MDTDNHGWICVNDSLAGNFVSGDALAAGCDLTISLLRLCWEPRKDTENTEGFFGGGRGSTRAANLGVTDGLWVWNHGGGRARGEERRMKDEG